MRNIGNGKEKGAALGVLGFRNNVMGLQGTHSGCIGGGIYIYIYKYDIGYDVFKWEPDYLQVGRVHNVEKALYPNSGE